ncbi:Uma2 family endonuclease [Streptomyces sp. XD-27]|uniref:Uma2 family endonuclease n=1 Tax=Streptomyces sp. XD-27 TaxID=3062779 RepID=UPI00350E5A05
MRQLKCVKGSGNLDLPGTENWYLPDIAIIPEELARGAKSLSVDEAILVVEVTSESNAADDRVKKRRRYGQFGVPLYLLVDRMDRTWTLFSDPVHDGYATEVGPHPFGEPVSLPQPFGIELDTSGI